MVRIAIAGANSGLALEVIDKLVEDQKHQVVALCRKDPKNFPQQPNVEWVQTTYQDKEELVHLFKGVEVVLNFIVVTSDVGNQVSKRLINASIEAGVKRYAPSEWAMSQKLYDIISIVPWYQNKLDTQTYLREINKDKKPGMFMEYGAFPRQLTKHVPPMPTLWQINELRVVAVKGHENEPVTLTSVSDIAAVVRHAIEYDGEWPEIGGIRGANISPQQLKEVIERIQGKPAQLDFANGEDLDAGKMDIEMPLIQHPSIPEDQRALWHAPGWIGIIQASAKGAWTVTDEWNKLLPDYEFLSVEDLVRDCLGKN